MPEDNDKKRPAEVFVGITVIGLCINILLHPSMLSNWDLVHFVGTE